MRKRVLDVAARSAWTFAQAFVGVLLGLDLTTGHTDWRAVLVSASLAGTAAVLKGLGVNASQILAARNAVKAVADNAPAVTHSTVLHAVVMTSEEVAARVAAQELSVAEHEDKPAN